MRTTRILVIDDNRDQADSLIMLLSAIGYETYVAYDGSQGLQVALDAKPDVIISDIGLPLMNGYVLARRLRQEPTMANVPIIAISGYGNAENQQQAWEAGFTAYLVKPTSLAELASHLPPIVTEN